MSGSVWTKELDKRLVDAKAKGLSFAQVANKIGVSRNAALGRYARITGALYPCFERRRQAALAVTRKQREEAEARHAIALQAFDRDLSSGKDRDAAIASAIARGCSRRALAERLEITRERIRQIIVRVEL